MNRLLELLLQGYTIFMWNGVADHFVIHLEPPVGEPLPKITLHDYPYIGIEEMDF